MSESTGHTDPSLHGLERRPVDERFVGLEVDQLAEANLAEVDAVGENLPDAGVGAVDAGCMKEGTYLGNHYALDPLLESLRDQASRPGIWFEDAIACTGISRRNPADGEHAPGDGPGLSRSRSLPDRASHVFAHGADHGPREPLSSVGSSDLAEVERHHLPTGGFDSRDDLLLDLQRAHQSVEVGGHDDRGLAGFYGLHGGSETLASFKRRSTRNVQFVDRAQKFEPIPFAGIPYSRHLFAGRRERLSLTAPDGRDPDDPKRPPQRDGMLLKGLIDQSNNPKDARGFG